jgi:outer membrane biogenesis lipoprotein LolB
MKKFLLSPLVIILLLSCSLFQKGNEESQNTQEQQEIVNQDEGTQT